jgi:CSLREA domain-containing protein
MTSRSNLFVVLGCALTALTLLATPVSRADTFVVNSTLDDVDATPGDGNCWTVGGRCTLRAAIQETNALAGDDTIELPAGVFYLTRAGGGEDAAATGDLDITDAGRRLDDHWRSLEHDHHRRPVRRSIFHSPSGRR